MKLSKTVKDIFKYSDLSVPDQGTSRKPPRKRSKTGQTSDLLKKYRIFESQMLIFNFLLKVKYFYLDKFQLLLDNTMHIHHLFIQNTEIITIITHNHFSTILDVFFRKKKVDAFVFNLNIFL